MPAYETLKHRLVHLNEEIIRILEDAETVAELSDENLSRWKSTCRTIGAQLADEMMRVAVVGAIKSGKSTFVNTIFGGDYLKRGAGVVTSIVTRVRAGSRLRAMLYLKRWDEVNRDIDEAAVLLPAQHRTPTPFDIRRSPDRHRLFQALDELAADQLIVNDTRSAGSVLMAAYLDGYDRLREWVAADDATVTFADARFALHRDFVGDDAMAVYLKDVLLEIDSAGLGEGVEIADCQGSDSPNPLHLAMIQDYLMVAHLTIYVISSRTGLRQADIRFLSMIRQMGILETVIFVVNCDFSEHESLEELLDGVRKIEADLRLICPDPHLFTFSALFTLMSQMTADLSERDRARFDQWRAESAMNAFAAEERARFDRLLDQKINRERRALLLRNHLERLELVTDGIGGWIAFNRDLLARDADGARELADRASRQQKRFDQLKATVKNAIDGAVGALKVDQKAAIDRLFNEPGEGIVDGVVGFINRHPVDLARYTQSVATAGFANTLYLVFQQFREAVDAYMAETVNPQVIRFVKAQEQHLTASLDEIVGPYGAVIEDALSQYSDALDGGPLDRQRLLPPISVHDDLSAIRQLAGLSLPPAAATMHYSAHIKTEAVMRFGFYKIVNWIRRVFNRSAHQGANEPLLALASAVKRMKRETERSMRFHLKDYRENFKYQYMLKLVDAAAAALYQQVLERFRHRGADLSRLAALINEQGVDKGTVAASLARLGDTSRTLREKIRQTRRDLQQLNG